MHAYMHAKPALDDPAQSLLQRATFKVHLQVQSLAVWRGRTSQEKASEILGRAIRPRRRPPESQLYGPVSVWRNIQISVIEVEPGFGVSEFEIYAPRAHPNSRDAVGIGGSPLQQELEIARTCV